MYNMLFGNNEMAGELLKILDLEAGDFGRFRDCYLSKDKKRIIVYTRCGGGNREYYEDMFDEMMEHPLYITDYDDDFDCTYASIEFKLPDEYIEKFKELDIDTTTGSEKFDMLFKKMEENK